MNYDETVTVNIGSVRSYCIVASFGSTNKNLGTICVSINAYHSGSCWDRNYDWVCRIEGERRVMHIAVIRMYFNWTRNLLYYTIVPRLNK